MGKETWKDAEGDPNLALRDACYSFLDELDYLAIPWWRWRRRRACSKRIEWLLETASLASRAHRVASEAPLYPPFSPVICPVCGASEGCAPGCERG